jgi:hypothetical protein
MSEPGSKSWAGADGMSMLLLILFPALKLFLHLYVGYFHGYDYHRDELYYLVCADRLDWGYVDHPPFSVWLLALTRSIVGDSLPAIRIVPALAGALTVFLVGLTTRDLGGRTVALALAMAVAVGAPFYLALDAFYSMNALDLLVWAAAGWLLVRILRGDSPHLWLVLGGVLGIGLENKIGVLWLGAGLLVGLILSPQRRLLATRGPWLAGAIAAALFIPHLVWQVSHGWPTLEFMHNATAQKLVRQSLRSIISGQLDGMLRISPVIWGAGLAFFLWAPEGRRFRVLGWAWLTVVAILVSARTVRGAYFAPAHLWLLAGGGVAIEHWLSRRGRVPRVAMPAVLLVLITLASVGAMPFVLPILPQERLAARSLATDGGRRVEERSGIGLLPEFLGHMNGWTEIVDQINAVYTSLPLDERSRAAILISDYGMAAAVDVLGRSLGLPRALSGHNAYWMWGPGENALGVAIVVGLPEPKLREWFEEVNFSGRTRCKYCLPYESDRPVWIVRRPRLPVRQIWAQLKLFG